MYAYSFYTQSELLSVVIAARAEVSFANDQKSYLLYAIC